MNIRKSNKNNGITLIALIITIIVFVVVMLLILLFFNCSVLDDLRSVFSFKEKGRYIF